MQMQMRTRLQVPLKFPVLFHGFDSPIKLLAQRLGKELLDRDVKLLREDHRQTGVDVILQIVSSTSHGLRIQ